MITRCTSCLGKKTIVGLGGIMKDCPVCDGIGHVTVVLEHSDDKPQRSRQKKVQDERTEA